MNAQATALSRGRVDGRGLLVEADTVLLALQEAAGGGLDGPFVVPSLAGLVRLAARLGTPITRSVIVPFGDEDLSVWVRLKPDASGTDITLAQNERPAVAPPSVDKLALAAHAALAEAGGWHWQVDRRLCFRVAAIDTLAPGHPRPRIGEGLTRYFRLEEKGAAEANDPLPLLTAAAAGRPCVDQLAVVRDAPRWRYRLTALPLFDVSGRLSGFRGRAIELGDPAHLEAASLPVDDRRFEARLDLALRQPLERIVANASSIGAQADGPLGADYVAYAGEIAEAGRHLIALVGDLADLRAVERPDFRTQSEQVDLADLARRAAGLLKLRALERHITITTPPEGEPRFARAEYRRVLQIFVNLVGNAVRYSPDHSQIWIRTDAESDDGMVAVMVADQGRGIDAADHERIFARFERLEPGDGTGGSGLGLYISRLLARAMGGDITVDSARGQGARFTLTLPAWR